MRALNCAFIAVFMAMLMLPLVFVDLASDRISVQENRMLANPPTLTDMKSRPDIFIRSFDDWFKDSTGFRERLIMFYNIMNNNPWYIGICYTDGQSFYLNGEEGHVYTSSNLMLSKFRGRQVFSDDQLANMAVKLEEVKTYLDRKGIPMLVMFCADKESIYPEFYPKSIKRGPEPIQLDIITEYLQQNTSIDVFNIRQALLAERNNYLLYPRLDDRVHAPRDWLHYNEIGAFFAYHELMRHINVYFPEIIPYELDDVDINYDWNGTPGVSLKARPVHRQLDSSFFDNVNIDRPFTLHNEAYENENSDLPVILFMRDSYTYQYFFGAYFPSHFGKAIFIHYENIEHFEEYIDIFKPDIVVFESAERMLYYFADCIAKIPVLP